MARIETRASTMSTHISPVKSSGLESAQLNSNDIVKEIKVAIEGSIKILTLEMEKQKVAFDQAMVKMNTQLTQMIDSRLADLKSNIELENAMLRRNVETMQTRFETLEDSVNKVADFDPDYTIVAERLPMEQGEDILARARKLVAEELGLRDIRVLRAKRLETKGRGLGIVKMQFSSVADKVTVLRHKRDLRNIRGLSNTYLRSSMSHVERLNHLNFRTLLRHMPDTNLFMSGNVWIFC